MSKQPEALRLADELERSVNNPHLYWQGKAAAELRRLHALNVELVEALQALVVSAGHEINSASDADLMDGVADPNQEDETRMQLAAFLRARAALAKASS